MPRLSGRKLILVMREGLEASTSALSAQNLRKVIHQGLPALEEAMQHILDAEPPPNATSQGNS